MSAAVQSPIARVRPQPKVPSAFGCKTDRDTLAESCPNLCDSASSHKRGKHVTEPATLEKIDSAISLSADNNDNDINSPNGCEHGAGGGRSCEHDAHRSPIHNCSECRYG